MEVEDGGWKGEDERCRLWRQYICVWGGRELIPICNTIQGNFYDKDRAVYILTPLLSDGALTDTHLYTYMYCIYYYIHVYDYVHDKFYIHIFTDP